MPAIPAGTVVQNFTDNSGAVIATVTQNYDPVTRAMISIVTNNTSGKKLSVTLVRTSDGATTDASITNGTHTYNAGQLGSFGITSYGDLAVSAGI